MKITYLEIENIKGISYIEIKPGSITRIHGANGSGKSSIIDAVTCVFDGGSDPGWLRKGADVGFVRFQISDDRGNLVATATKTVTRKEDGAIKSELSILDPHGVSLPAPQTFVKKLGESWAVDPSKILSVDTSTAAGRKSLMAYLLNVMPISFSTADMLATGVPDPVVPKAATATLDDLTKARKYVEEMRKKTGVEAREAEASVNALRGSLPKEGDKFDWTAKLAALQADRNALVAREGREKGEIEHAAGVEGRGIEQDYGAKEAALREEFNAKLDALREEKSKALEALTATARAAMAEVTTVLAPEHDRITSELATAREKSEQQQRSAGVRASLETFGARVREKNAQYDALTRTLEKLDALKKTKMDNLPVEGLGFDGDTVTVDGVEWHHVNTARRAMVAAQIASLRAGDLPFMVVDDAEHLDPDTMREFEEQITAAGFQVIEAIACRGALTVEHVE